MKTKCILLVGILAIAIASYAQTNTSGSTQKTVSAFEKMMNETGYPYTKFSDSTASIKFDGTDVIKSYSVIVLKTGGAYVAFVDISTTMGIKVDPSKYKSILRANNSFDLIKFGLEEDGSITARYEIYESGLTSKNLKRIINQLAAAAEEIAPQLK